MRYVSGVEDEEELIPTDHTIYPPYPNPFNSTSNVKVDLKSPSRVVIKAYDILGRELFSQNQFLPQGTHRIPLQFDMAGRSIASGPIIVRVETAKKQQSFRVIHMQ